MHVMSPSNYTLPISRRVIGTPSDELDRIQKLVELLPLAMMIYRLGERVW